MMRFCKSYYCVLHISTWYPYMLWSKSDVLPALLYFCLQHPPSRFSLHINFFISNAFLRKTVKTSKARFLHNLKTPHASLSPELYMFIFKIETLCWDCCLPCFVTTWKSGSMYSSICNVVCLKQFFDSSFVYIFQFFSCLWQSDKACFLLLCHAKSCTPMLSVWAIF